jgi:ubiquinone/menaquinone biosynthesis C-methylase UbiE
MAQRVCPWWFGYWLASPLRRLTLNPDALLQPFIKPGMLVLEPGPGMGFFTLPLARMVGPAGRIVAVDVQQKMLDSLERRARHSGLRERIEPRLAGENGMGIGAFGGRVDFALAFAMVHEVPDPARFFREVASALKPGGRLLFCEPAGHVSESQFAESLSLARSAGMSDVTRLVVRGNLAAVLTRR